MSLDQEIPPSVKELVKVLGKPRVHTLSREMPAEVDSPDTDTESCSNLASLYSVTKHKQHPCHTPDTQCPLCDLIAVKAMDLYYHIKDLHPGSLKYQCWDCDKCFQTDHDRINHMKQTHREKQYSYKSCLYTAIIESRMHAHICVHTSKKFPYLKCDSQLSSRAALRKHTLLHLSTEEQKCFSVTKLMPHSWL